MALTFSPEQLEALAAFDAQENIFLTGPGGSGKSALIRHMVMRVLAQHRKVQVCALTGCAALLLDCKAKTVHGWAGIGLATGPSDLVVKRILANKFIREKWTTTDVLIIDEVSMMSQKLFELLDACGKATRGNQRPFGGLHLVCSGDFYQLPPVPGAGAGAGAGAGQDVAYRFINSGNFATEAEADAAEQEAAALDKQTSAAFCFESPLWPRTFTSTIQLRKIFRQTDLQYQKILNEVRVGRMHKSSLNLLYAQVGKPQVLTGLKPTILLPRRRDVDAINAAELAKLPSTTARLFVAERVEVAVPQYKKMRFDESNGAREYKTLLANLRCDVQLTLKVGAQVMCIVNMDGAIVNGSQGVVIDFVDNAPLVEFANGVTQVVQRHLWQSEYMPTVGIKQIPLIHAWAITIHKAQGTSLALAEIDAGSNIFECGQTYVALSRVQSLQGLYLAAFDPMRITVNTKVQEFYAGLQTRNV